MKYKQLVKIPKLCNEVGQMLAEILQVLIDQWWQMLTNVFETLAKRMLTFVEPLSLERRNSRNPK